MVHIADHKRKQGRQILLDHRCRSQPTRCSVMAVQIVSYLDPDSTTSAPPVVAIDVSSWSTTGPRSPDVLGVS